VAEYAPIPVDVPFTRLGGEAAVRPIVERFYDRMESLEPELAALHERDAERTSCGCLVARAR
jgi:truncated hemoglobin YjbI